MKSFQPPFSSVRTIYKGIQRVCFTSKDETFSYYILIKIFIFSRSGNEALEMVGTWGTDYLNPRLLVPTMCGIQRESKKHILQSVLQNNLPPQGP